jgi:hypothetical protein
MYVLKCLSDGKSNQTIVEDLAGDERRVSLWMTFAKDTHLLNQNRSGKWLVSDKGRSWIEGYS